MRNRETYCASLCLAVNQHNGRVLDLPSGRTQMLDIHLVAEDVAPGSIFDVTSACVQERANGWSLETCLSSVAIGRTGLGENKHCGRGEA